MLESSSLLRGLPGITAYCEFARTGPGKHMLTGTGKQVLLLVGQPCGDAWLDGALGVPPPLRLPVSEGTRREKRITRFLCAGRDRNGRAAVRCSIVAYPAPGGGGSSSCGSLLSTLSVRYTWAASLLFCWMRISLRMQL